MSDKKDRIDKKSIAKGTKETSKKTSHDPCDKRKQIESNARIV